MTDEPAIQDWTGAPTGPNPDGQAPTQAAERERELTAILRAVTSAMGAATTREALAEQLCDRLADRTHYQTVCMGDRQTWVGQCDSWTVRGTTSETPPISPVLREELFGSDDQAAVEPVSSLVTIDSGRAGRWLVVPLVSDGTVYGALGVLSMRHSIDDRERTVLRELGTVIGHAISAIETRRLLAEPAVVSIELVGTETATPLVEAARRAGCQFTLDGIVPATDAGGIAFLTVDPATLDAATESLASASDGAVERITAESDGLLAWTAGADTLLGQLLCHGAHVSDLTATEERAEYAAELASCADVRSLLECVGELFPETYLKSKRELDRSVEPCRSLTHRDLAALTDRQREVVEAAYHAGYYRWPRAASAEEVADMLDISSATLHGHLRKAEAHLLDSVFDPELRQHRST